MGYFVPIFALGKTSQKTASSAVSSGDTSLAIDNSGGEYAAGDHVFVSDSGGDNNQYVGTVVSAAAASITVSMAVANDLGSSALVWKPTYSVAFSRGYGPDVTYRRFLGSSTSRTLGNQIESTRTADSGTHLTLTWEGRMTQTDFGSLLTFVDSRLQGGRDTFNFGWWDFSANASRVSRVRWATRDPDLQENVVAGRMTTEEPERLKVVVELYVVETDGYET